MADDATIAIRLTGNAEKKLKSLDKRFDKLGKTTQRVGRQGSAALRSVGRGADWAGRKIRRLGVGAVRWMGRMTKYATLAGAAFATWQVVKGIKLNAQLEQYNTSLGVMYRSASRAAGMLKYLVKFSEKTPFMFDEVVRGGVMLRGFGLDIKQNLTVAGDTAAAFGKDITEVARALGLLNAGASGEAVESFRRMGVNLREVRGLDWAKSGQLKTAPDVGLPLIRNYLEQRFGGMMQKQSKTGAGLYSTVMGQVGLLRADFTRGVFDKLKGKLAELSKTLDSVGSSETWQRLKAGFSAAFGKGIDYLERLLALFAKVQKEEGLGEAFGAVWKEVEPPLMGLLAKAAIFFAKVLVKALMAAFQQAPLLTGGLGAAYRAPMLMGAGGLLGKTGWGRDALGGAGRGIARGASWIGRADGALSTTATSTPTKTQMKDVVGCGCWRSVRE